MSSSTGPSATTRSSIGSFPMVPVVSVERPPSVPSSPAPSGCALLAIGGACLAGVVELADARGVVLLESVALVEGQVLGPVDRLLGQPQGQWALPGDLAGQRAGRFSQFRQWDHLGGPT